MRKISLILLTFSLALILGAGLTGCGYLSSDKPSVCTTIPEGEYSVICQVAGKIGKSPEAVAGVLKLANLGSLAGDVYKAKRAKAFIAELRSFLKDSQISGIAYSAALKYAAYKYQTLPPNVRIAFVLLKDMYATDLGKMGDTLLSKHDYEMLFRHLDDQEAMLAPFLAGQ